MNKIFIRLIGGNIQTNHVGIIILYFVINVEWKLRSEMKVMEFEIKGFIVKSLITAIGILATVQGLVSYFMK